MSEGVEWALHCCVNLAWMEGRAVTAARLAGFYSLPAAYLNKQLQLLVKAGLLTSVSGPRGGFRLARPASAITLLDVVTAIEGGEDAFRCQEILRDSPDGRQDVDYRRTCALSIGMRRAELAWRRELAAQTLADVITQVERHTPDAPSRTRTQLT